MSLKFLTIVRFSLLKSFVFGHFGLETLVTISVYDLMLLLHQTLLAYTPHDFNFRH